LPDRDFPSNSAKFVGGVNVYFAASGDAVQGALQRGVLASSTDSGRFFGRLFAAAAIEMRSCGVEAVGSLASEECVEAEAQRDVGKSRT